MQFLQNRYQVLAGAAGASGAAFVGAASSVMTAPPPQLPSAHPLVQSEQPLVQLEHSFDSQELACSPWQRF